MGDLSIEKALSLPVLIKDVVPVVLSPTFGAVGSGTFF